MPLTGSYLLSSFCHWSGGGWLNFSDKRSFYPKDFVLCFAEVRRTTTSPEVLLITRYSLLQ